MMTSRGLLPCNRVAYVRLIFIVSVAVAGTAPASADPSPNPEPDIAINGTFCVHGVSAGADAERADDASDNDAALAAVQKSIESYGQCIDESDYQGTPKGKVNFYAERAHERRLLLRLLTKAQRQDDAQHQLSAFTLDLDLACQKFDDLTPSNQTSARIDSGYLIRNGLETQAHLSACRPLEY